MTPSELIESRSSKTAQSLTHGACATGLLALAMLYAGWQFAGLRYTTHDDIYFNLQHYLRAHDVMGFSAFVARDQARVQAYVNMPLILFVDGLARTGWYDVLNIGSALLTYVTFVWMLCGFGSPVAAAGMATVALMLFPLHYFFTFPQGFPVMGCWGFASAMASVALLGDWLVRPARWRLALSYVLFTISLAGPEYDLVLHPLLIAVRLAAGPARGRGALRIGAGFFMCWVLCLAVYAGYALYRHVVSTPFQHTTPGLDVSAIWQTFWLLQEMAFLPSALIRGLHLDAAGARGLAPVPSVLTFASLIRNMIDYGSVAVVWVVSTCVAMAASLLARMSRRSIGWFGLVCVLIATIPTAVVSTSIAYQHIVMLGYLQGHLAAFYTQLGTAGLIFLAGQLVIAARSGRARIAVAALCACAIGADVSVTFVYNNLNRQVMSANRQRWDAFAQFASYVASARPELLHMPIAAPDYWHGVAVSSIPGDSLREGPNYWTSYATSVLHVPLLLTEGKPASDAPVTSFIATPSGTAVSLMLERSSGAGRLTMLAMRPIGGRLRLGAADPVIAVETSRWRCDRICSIVLDVDGHVTLEGIAFSPAKMGPRWQIGQFLVSRSGAFGDPALPPALGR